ncbi:MAG: phosphopentomutase [candidate division Zixibacteria bacterium]|nr:phosphopentomutase [candidate division Zixibacteria bacterium]
MKRTDRRFNRVIVLVLDGVGVGELPDAGDFGDEGSDSLGNVVKARGKLQLPHLARRGLGRLSPLPGFENVAVTGGYGKMAMTAAGKDSTSGHWEIAGLVLRENFPVFPDGFPKEVVENLKAATGYEFIGNRAASGTEIVAQLGGEHLRRGALILYTSADSVCQIAAHTDVVPLQELYGIGEKAREVMTGPYRVGRVIVRPFAGEPGSFRRLNDARRDYSLAPPAPTLLDELSARGFTVSGVGKVDDIFAGRGFTRYRHTEDNAAGISVIKSELSDDFEGLVLADLNDTDTVFGHRNDAEGYARALERFDEALPAVESEMDAKDLLLIVSDHGNDPTTPSTDHSREYAPLLAWHRRFQGAVSLGTRASLADVGQTVAQNFGAGPLAAGTSFLNEI